MSAAYRLDLARKMGVDLALDVSRDTIADAQRHLGMVEGFDVALEMSGHPDALPEVIDNLNHGGRIAMLGLPSAPIEIDWAKVVSHMITIKGIYGREMYRDLVRDERDAALRAGHQRGHHPPAAGPRVGEGVRDGSQRAVRQGRHGLDGGLGVYGSVGEQLRATIEEIREAGLYKTERAADVPAVGARRLRGQPRC